MKRLNIFLVIDHLFRRVLEEPIGIVIPLIVLFIVFMSPQMPDLFAGMIYGNEGGELRADWWRPLGVGISAALLGFCAWFWTRAALFGRRKIDDFYYCRGAANLGSLEPEESWSIEWLPRLSVLFAAAISIAPLLIEFNFSSLTLGDAPFVAPVLGTILVIAVFFLTVYRRRLGLCSRVRAERWMWSAWTTSTFAAAPWGWPAAIILLAFSFLGVVITGFSPELIEETFHTPTAALGALALVIGPLVIILAASRDIVLFLLILIRYVVRLTNFESISNNISLAPVRLKSTSGVIGLFLFIIWMIIPAYDLRAHRYWVRMTETGLVETQEEACGAQPAAGRAMASSLCRDDIRKTLHKWRGSQLRGGYSPDRPMPIIIVAAQGGASRAAVWFLAAMERLDRATENQFGRYLFGISSVSGGSLGAATYLLALDQYHLESGGIDWENRKLQRGLRELAQGDLLAASLATYFLNDTLALFSLVWTLDDRGVALEKAFDRHWTWQHGFALSPVDVATGIVTLQQRSNAPHLFLNGTDAATGARIIASTIRFNETDDLFANADDLLDIVKHDIHPSSAVMVSARFPYVSPAGRFFQEKMKRQVIDGGYFENYGARTATELADKIKEISRGDNLNLVPLLVIISNDMVGERSEDKAEGNETIDKITVRCVGTQESSRITDNNTSNIKVKKEVGSFAFETLIPLLGLYSIREAHNEDALHSARRSYCVGPDSPYPRMFHLALPKIDAKTESAPLNWVLNPKAKQFLLERALDIDYNVSEVECLRRVLSEFVKGEDKDPRLMSNPCLGLLPNYPVERKPSRISAEKKSVH